MASDDECPPLVAKEGCTPPVPPAAVEGVPEGAVATKTLAPESTPVDINELKALIKSLILETSSAATPDEAKLAALKKAKLDLLEKIRAMPADNTPPADLPMDAGDQYVSNGNAKNSNLAIDIDPCYATLIVFAAGNEASDPNFPKNLHMGMQLFGMHNMLPQARACKNSVDTYKKLLAAGPDNSSVSMGTACICWDCGIVALPENSDDIGEDLSKGVPFCSKCKLCEQCNFVTVKQPDGSTVPWIQAKGEKPPPKGTKAKKAGKAKPKKRK